LLNYIIHDILNIIITKSEVTMRETIIVSNRGQLTLPANLRKKFGLQKGGSVFFEERGSEIVLKPAVTLEIEIYSDSQIAEWDGADLLADSDRSAILGKLGIV
jgi:antitoxin PrlF